MTCFKHKPLHVSTTFIGRENDTRLILQYFYTDFEENCSFTVFTPERICGTYRYLTSTMCDVMNTI